MEYKIKIQDNEVTIQSDNLNYAELYPTHVGCQSNSIKNNNKIKDKCIKISALIKDIELLNTKSKKEQIEDLFHKYEEPMNMEFVIKNQDKLIDEILNLF